MTTTCACGGRAIARNSHHTRYGRYVRWWCEHGHRWTEHDVTKPGQRVRAGGCTCPECGGFAFRWNSRNTDYGKYIRWRCNDCGHRWTEYDTWRRDAERKRKAERLEMRVEALRRREAERRWLIALADRPRLPPRQLAKLLPDVTTPGLRARLESSLSATRSANTFDGAA